MASPSKEENILDLILESSPLKEWHFEEMVSKAKLTRAIANKWLKRYQAEGLIKRVKEKGSFPHYTVGENNRVYRSLKRIYALNKLHRCGLIPRLLSIDSAKTVILFGSMAKGDWYKDSDIDIFIFGNAEGIDKNHYELILRKHIELHVFNDRAEIDKVETGLIRNVVNGYVIKGRIQDIINIS